MDKKEDKKAKPKPKPKPKSDMFETYIKID